MLEDEYRLQAHQVARMLGVPARTVRRWAANGALPVKRKGPKLWFFPNDPAFLLQAYMLADRQRKKVANAL
ncbi:MAG: helix-turn-helix domain-containing protein [Pseudolabrys sp.]|nr:helix-turn-helix domain-containing protein [Pseudolabrys sp.]